MRVLRVVLATAAFVAGSAILLLAAAPTGAQTTGTTVRTTTTIRSLPVTGATTTTTARAAVAAADGDLASTGMAADALVPFGFALIASGAAMTAAARRSRRVHLL